jgi:hypothetical protein
MDKHIETTIGQLNFFKWVIENNILRYVEDNIDVIENDMIQAHKKKKNDGNSTIVNNIKFNSSSHSMNKMDIPMIISFN